jgi:hypothetical protein
MDNQVLLDRIRDLEAALVQAQGGVNHILFEKKLGGDYHFATQYIFSNLADGVVIWPKDARPEEDMKYVAWLVDGIFALQEDEEAVDELCRLALARLASSDCHVRKPGEILMFEPFTPDGKVFRKNPVGSRYGSYVTFEATTENADGTQHDLVTEPK